MAIFKCKMCGGTIEFEPGATVGICEYCGTKQTLPKLSDDRRANLYDRANHFRRNNEFDKAAGIYEQILNEDTADAEAYWSLVLCRYGIEYVEDPATRRRVPTVNRAQFTSVFDDDNYKSALQHADGYQRAIYEAEAKEINEIQKGILAISQKEEPFDVFICYKETDNNGRRTQDSVLANDLYHQLTQEGFKVFFARITLEDKLGSAYEPYIFAALNSAKVMVVLGTKPEHFNAVWVKNEWSRYLALVKKSGGKKVLIPAYRDMDPYDLPEEFSHLQAQDMSKLGFMQDLIRGIKKLAQSDEKPTAGKETVVVGGNANTAPLLRRAFMFLEDGNWAEANAYCEKVLDIDPENAEAYLGKLMTELKVRKRENLRDCAEPFDDSGNYQKAVRFGGGGISDELSGAVASINERNEHARLDGIYNRASNIMHAAQTEDEYQDAASLFESIPDYQDANVLAEECREKAEIARKDAILSDAKEKLSKIYTGATFLNSNYNSKINRVKAVIDLLQSIPGWKDADEQVAVCWQKIEEIKATIEADRLEAERKAEERRIAAEKAAKKRKKIIMITTPIVCAVIAFVIVLTKVIIPNGKYNDAVALIDKGDIVNAYEKLVALNGYKDSTAKANEIFEEYKIEKLKVADVGDIVYFGSYEQDNNTTNGKEDIEWFVLDVADNKVLLISKYALDCQPYNTFDTDVTWETCTLRTWLNGTFLHDAFSAEEQANIAATTVSADANPEYDTNPGNATNDQVFLLSITEAEKYFTTDESRKCAPTAYAKAQGAWTSDSYKTASGEATCWWWLRSPGYTQDGAASVDLDGAVSSLGHYVNDENDAVRPALWINLDS